MNKYSNIFLLLILVCFLSPSLMAQYSSSAHWPLTVSSTTSVITAGQLLADEEKFINTEVNGYTGANGAQRIRMAGTNNWWPANLKNQIDTVYVQFSVSPKPGTSLKIDTVKFWIGASSSSTFKANAYFSADPTFASNTMINYVTGNNNNYLTSGGETEVIALPAVEINDTQKFYVRMYPWNEDTAEKQGKYMTLRDVVISGTYSGSVISDPPTLTTTQASYVSTTFLTSGGKITNDGGADVTARGVVWNTTGSPTVADNKTEDGTGVGTFVSKVTGLTAGTKYFIRAYAANSAGTSYGFEFTATTLSVLSVPTVSTTSISNIFVTTAESGGNITDWGGDSVTFRGICWSTNSSPTVSDAHTEDGSDIGSFKSGMSELIQNTKYYVRAYAVNIIGTGYGEIVEFTTLIPSPAVKKIVAADGSGDYTTIQAAFNAVPDSYTGPYTIYVKKGVYKEKLLLGSKKVNVILVGEDRDNTILTYDDYAGKAGGTNMSYSISIEAPDFIAADITFQNTIVKDNTFNDQQAVALRSNGDRQAFYNCKLLGYQDTYYAYGGSGVGRVYMKDCYIEGSVDFIFGRDVVVFDNCELHVNREGCSITAASTEATSKFGFVFKNCTISNDSIDYEGKKISTIYLGRAWNGKPRTVFMNTFESEAVVSQGWNQNPINSGIIPAVYGVYQNSGPGFDVQGHGTGIGSILTSSEASEYTVRNIFSKKTDPSFGYDWMPDTLAYVGVKDIPGENNISTSFSLNQNYPNPFNPATKIEFNIPKQTKIKLEVFDILGRKVTTLVDENKAPGKYDVTFNAAHLSSGLYIYRLSSIDQSITRKMLLIK